MPGLGRRRLFATDAAACSAHGPQQHTSELSGLPVLTLRLIRGCVQTPAESPLHCGRGHLRHHWAARAAGQDGPAETQVRKLLRATLYGRAERRDGVCFLHHRQCFDFPVPLLHKARPMSASVGGHHGGVLPSK